MADEQNVEEKVLSKKELKAQAKKEKELAKEKAKQDKLKRQKVQKKEKRGLFKRIKDSWGELRRTTWPTFGTVVKKTGVVLLVVILFTAVLFGIDAGLGALYRLLIG
jgi:preprotein translocase subunit SecE